MDQYKTNPWLVATVALLATIIGAGAMYFLKPTPPPSPFQPLTVREAVDPAAEKPSPTQTNEYRNEKLGLSLTIPEGYRVVEHDNRLDIVKKPTPQDETPMPDLTVNVTKGDQTYVLGENEKFETAEDFPVNGIPGKRYKVVQINPPSNVNIEYCDFYRFAGTGYRAYEFRRWECLESPIFDQVVQSLKLLK